MTANTPIRSLVGRLKALELASAGRIDAAQWRSKAARDAFVAAAPLDSDAMTAALVAAGPVEGQAHAAIRAFFRADH